MTLPLDLARVAVAAEWAHFSELLTSAEDAWAAPTRLEGWTVRGLAAHAVWGISMEADALRRLRIGAEGRAVLRGPTVALGFRYEEGWVAIDADEHTSPAAIVDGDDTAIVLFALGRIPADDARLSVTGDAAVAERFKAWLPGS